jgi:hypothetical protein
VFRNDLLGQVIYRREEDESPVTGGPHEHFYRFSGRQMGYVGNNSSFDVDYAQSIKQRADAAGLSSFADFDLVHDHS